MENIARTTQIYQHENSNKLVEERTEKLPVQIGINVSSYSSTVLD